MNCKEFIELVESMRLAQKTYFSIAAIERFGTTGRCSNYYTVK